MAAPIKKRAQTEDLNRLYASKVCDLLYINRRTLKNWMELEDDPCPYVKNDGADFKIDPYIFEWPRVLAWYVKREVNKSLRRYGDAPVDAAEADFRNKAAAATLKEMKILQQQGVLVEASKIESVWTNKIQTAKKLLLTVPHKAALTLGDGLSYQQRKVAIEREIEAALRTLADADVPAPEPLAEGEVED